MYVRRKTIKGHTYYYLVRSVREGDKVRQVFVRYLGKNLPASPSSPADRSTPHLSMDIHLLQNAKAYLEKPMQSGLIVFRGEGGDRSGVGKTVTVLGSHYSSSKAYADSFAADGNAEAFIIDPEARLFDFDIIRQELWAFQHGNAQHNIFVKTPEDVTNIGNRPEALTQKLRQDYDGILNGQPDGSVEFVVFNNRGVIAWADFLRAQRAEEYAASIPAIENQIKAIAGSDNILEITFGFARGDYTEEVGKPLEPLFDAHREAEDACAAYEEFPIDPAILEPKTLDDFYKTG